MGRVGFERFGCNMKNETVLAEVVESKKYKRPELFFGIGQSQSGRWIALGDFASREKANNYMRGETDYANISIVRVPQEDETAIDWKKRAKRLANQVAVIVQCGHALNNTSPAYHEAVELIKELQNE